MLVKRAETLGYCAGVRRALDLVYKARRDFPDKKIFTYGPLIHNEEVLELLRLEGIVDLCRYSESEVKGFASEAALVILRAHGLPPETALELEGQGFSVIDATCPRVKRSQQIAADFAAEGRLVIIAGDREHGEVAGLAGYVAAGQNRFQEAQRDSRRSTPTADRTRAKSRTESLDPSGAQVPRVFFVPKEYLPCFQADPMTKGSMDNRIVSGVPSVASFDENSLDENPFENSRTKGSAQIQEILDTADEVKIDRRHKKTRLVFIKTDGKNGAAAVGIGVSGGQKNRLAVLFFRCGKSTYSRLETIGVPGPSPADGHTGPESGGGKTSGFPGGPVVIHPNTSFAEDVQRLNGGTYALVGQSTLRSAEYAKIAADLGVALAAAGELVVADTVCPEAEKRQEAVRCLAPQVEGILVVGGKDSANTRRLFELAAECGTDAAHIQGAADIPPRFFAMQRVGISAGASTPVGIVEEVEKKLLASTAAGGHPDVKNEEMRRGRRHWGT